MTRRKSQVNVIEESKEYSERFFTIGEFAKIAHTTPRALRLWHKKGLLTPAIQNKNNLYRFYKLEQIYDVLNIKLNRELGIPLNAMKHSKINSIKNILKNLNNKIRILEKKRKFLEFFLKFKTNPKRYLKYTKLKQMYLLIYTPPKTATYSQISNYIKLLWKCINKKQYFLQKEITMYYDQFYNPINSKIKIALIFKSKRYIKKFNLKKGINCNNIDIQIVKMSTVSGLRVNFIGPYRFLPLAYKLINMQIITENLNTFLPFYEIYIKGPLNTKIEFDCKTKIFIPLKKPKFSKLS